MCPHRSEAVAFEASDPDPGSGNGLGQLSPSHRDLSDSVLIERTRRGDATAYRTLHDRHIGSAEALARRMSRNPADADDLVSEGFARVLAILRAGRGPDVAFRPYLLSTIRRLAYDRTSGEQRVAPTDTFDELPPVPEPDPIVDGFEREAAAAAFSSLPERWQLVLWHIEVEGQTPAEVAAHLGMRPNSVAALAYRAREGLRQAYLSEHTPSGPGDRAECRWTARRMAAHVRGTLSDRHEIRVQTHLDDCDRCRVAHLELAAVNTSMPALIAVAVLGSAASTHLGAIGAVPLPIGAATAAITSGTGAGAAAGTASGAPATADSRAARVSAKGVAVTAGLAVIATSALLALALGLRARPAPSSDTASAPAPEATAPAPTTEPGTRPDPDPNPSEPAPDPDPDAPVPPTSAGNPPPIRPADPPGATEPGPTTTPTTGAPSIADPPTTVPPTTTPTTTTTAAPPTTTTTEPNTTTSSPPPDPIVHRIGIESTGGLVRGRLGVLAVEVDAQGDGDDGTPRFQLHLTGARLRTGPTSNPTGRSLATATIAADTGGPARAVSPGGGWTCRELDPDRVECTGPTMGAGASADFFLPVEVDPAAPEVRVSVAGENITGDESALAVTDDGFSARFAAVDRVGVASAGNAVIGCPPSAPGCNSNDSVRTVAIDVDDVESTFNSSAATIDLPDGAEVVSATLWWGGDLSAGTGGTAAPAPADRDRVWLTGPSGRSQMVRAERVDAHGTRYQAVADVTGLVDRGGRWTAADVQAGTGTNRYGGWFLTVVHHDPAAPVRSIAVLDGFSLIERNRSFDFTVGGFRVPDRGADAAFVDVFVYEGDELLVDDQLRVGDLDVTDDANPLGNTFNSTAAIFGRPAPGMDPPATSILAIDIDRIDVTDALRAGQRSTTVRFSTAGDVYLTGALVFSVDQ